jgi:hypothetical protein
MVLRPAEAARTVLRSAGSGASAQQALALPPEEPAVLDVPAAVASAQDAAEVLRQAAAVPGAAAEPRQEAARGAAVVRPQAAGALDAGAVLRLEEVPDAVAARLPEVALGAAAVRLRAERALPAALPLAVAWVFRRDRLLPSPAP